MSNKTKIISNLDRIVVVDADALPTGLAALDGGQLSNITGANVNGDVTSANYANFAGDVVNATQSNITGLGTLTGLGVDGNITLSSNGNIIFTDASVQVTAYPGILVNGGGGGGGYRGFAASVNRFWGDDPSVNQIIITNASAVAYNNASTDTNIDEFEATNLSGGNIVVMLNLYGDDSSNPLEIVDLTAVAEAFIDNVLYDGLTPVTDATTAKSRFYANWNTVFAAVNGKLYSSFQYLSPANFSGIVPTGGTGSDFSPYLINDPEIYLANGIANPGTGYTVGDTLTIDGSLLNGVSGVNDATFTITSVDVGGEVLAYTVSGSPVPSMPTNYISDGGNDQYDDGNYIETSASGGSIDYNNGVVTSDSEWGGGSEYVVTYRTSTWAMMAFNTAVSWAHYSGEMGADGSGDKQISTIFAGGGGSGSGTLFCNILFDGTGIQFPDNTIQTTAFTGISTKLVNGTTYANIADPNGNLVISVDNSNMSWTFATDRVIYGQTNERVTLSAIDDGSDIEVKQSVVDTNLNDLSRTELDRYSYSIDLDIQGSQRQWQFYGNELRTPDSGAVVRGFNSSVAVQAMNAGSNPVASLQSVSSVNEPNIFSTFDATTTSAQISVYPSGSQSSSAYTWQFGNDGNLTLPGNVFAVKYANGTLVDIDGAVANSNYANYAGTAYSVSGANVVGDVAGANVANVADHANIASIAYSVDAGNVVGEVANATFAVSAGSANVAYSVDAANVVGEVANATYAVSAGTATTALSVDGANVSGTVANANHAAYANIANTANVAYSVDAGNVVGNVAVANLAHSVSGSNVSGEVANANYATYAQHVTDASQPNITSVGTLTSLSVGGDATVTGNLTVSGNVTYANVNTVIVEDPVIQLGGGANGAPLTTNDGRDRGAYLHVYDTGAAAEVDKFMGWDNSNAEFAFGSNVTMANDVVTFNTFGNIRADAFIGTSVEVTGAANVGELNVTGNLSAANLTTVGGVVAFDINVTDLYVNGGFANLGNVTEVHITGGSNGQYLQTDGSGTLTWANIDFANAVVANASYANAAGVAYSVDAANVVGEVANATYAVSAGSSNVAYSVDAANVVGSVANANYATVAGTAYNVDAANVLGTVANASYAANAFYADYAGTAYSVDAGNIIGSIANANYATVAGTAYSVDAGNVVGSVANANHAANAYYADYAGTAYSVDAANISGTVANANYASYSGVAYSVDGANVSGDVSGADHANVADVANSVSGANVSGDVSGANYANYAGTSLSLENGTSNVSIPVASGNVQVTANGVMVIDTSDLETKLLANTITVNYDLNAGNRVYANTVEAAGNITAQNIEAYGSLTSAHLTATLSASFYEDASVGANLTVGGTVGIGATSTQGAGSLTTTSTATVDLITFEADEVQYVKLTIKAVRAGGVTSEELTIISDDTDIAYSQWNQLSMGTTGSIVPIFDNGTIRVQITPVSNNSTEWKYAYTIM